MKKIVSENQLNYYLIVSLLNFSQKILALLFRTKYNQNIHMFKLIGCTMKINEHHALQAIDICKQYSGVVVLDKVSFSLRAGEIHALLGGNGAGKSTLMKIISGIETADSGQLIINDKPCSSLSPAKAHKQGIYLVPQESLLFPNLSVKENILFQLPKSNQLEQLLEEKLIALNCNLDLSATAGTLDVADRQLVEIMRGLVREAKILIFDEPTASLTPQETSHLFSQMQTLKVSGVAQVFISHKIPEVMQIADYVTVIRDGSVALTTSINELDSETIIQAIAPINKTGNNADREHRVHLDIPKASEKGQRILRINHLTGEGFHNINMDIHAGEIIGLAGVVGAGRTELSETIFGIRKAYSGNLLYLGKDISAKQCAQRLEEGIVYLPEDRQSSGLFLDGALSWNVMSLTQNIDSFWLNEQKAIKRLELFKQSMAIKFHSPHQPARSLSGGNQQKVLIAKCLAAHPKLLIIDEPTRGVDIAARYDIYDLIRTVAKKNVAVLMISSDLEEIALLSNRVFVMHQGEQSGELTGDEISVDNMMKLAFGHLTQRVTHA